MQLTFAPKPAEPLAAGTTRTNPKDGLVYIATYAGKCEQCFTDLQCYCKVHNAWLTDEHCAKCETPGASVPVAVPAKSHGDFWLVLFFVGCLTVLAASVTVIWRIVARRKRGSE